MKETTKQDALMASRLPDLILPVYVDTNGLLDLLASIEEIAEIDFASQTPGGNKQNFAYQIKQLRRFAQEMLIGLETIETRLLVVDRIDAHPKKAVALAFVNYLRDKSMRELLNSEYRLLGKVVAKVSESKSIDLLEGTALSGIGEQQLATLAEGLNQVDQLKLPTIQTKIDGPALRVVPIAIYA